MASQNQSTRFSLESVMRGHHIYKSVWTPFVGKVFIIRCKEPRNRRDRFTVCYERLVMYQGNIQRWPGTFYEVVDTVVVQ